MEIETIKTWRLIIESAEEGYVTFEDRDKREG
jgi:hypothetical protein